MRLVGRAFYGDHVPPLQPGEKVPKAREPRQCLCGIVGERQKLRRVRGLPRSRCGASLACFWTR